MISIITFIYCLAAASAAGNLASGFSFVFINSTTRLRVSRFLKKNKTKKTEKAFFFVGVLVADPLYVPTIDDGGAK